MEQGSERPLAMLVDDSDEAEAIAAYIEKAGLGCVRAADTIAAESLFVSSMPGLIVISLDDEGAPAFCDLISAIPRGGGLPVILIGNPSKTMRTPLESSIRGALGYVERPVREDDLISVIRELLGPIELEEPVAMSSAVHTKESSVPAEPPSPLPEPIPTLGTGHREPTQILDDGGSADELGPSAGYGFSMNDFLSDSPVTFGFGSSMDDGPLPWELQLDVPPLGDEDEVDAASGTSTGTDTRFETDERPELDDATLDQPAPWASLLRAAPARPERTQVLVDELPRPFTSADVVPTPVSTSAKTADQSSAPSTGETFDDSEPGEGAVTQLSADFRRVIDEVAQRLFPEASPADYDDEHFDELQTVVPIVDHRAGDLDDIDDYSLEAMQTYTVGHEGFGISIVDGPPDEELGFASDTKNEDETGAQPTQQRHLEEGPEPQTSEAEAPPTFEATRQSELRDDSSPRRLETDADAQPLLEIDGVTLSYGELADHSVAQLLAAGLRSGFDGKLVLRPAELGTATDQTTSLPRREIIFDKGQPVVATSGLIQDRLIERMLKQGRLTKDQHRRCRSLIETTGRKAGAILVELGVIAARELFPLVRWHFREILYSCFSWKAGSFWLERRPPLSQWRIRLEPEGPKLLLEGLRRRASPIELQRQLGGESTRLRLAATLAEDLREAGASVGALPGLLRGEERLLPLCDGTRPLTMLLAESPIERGQALAVLRGLELLGLLERGGARAVAGNDLGPRDRALERARLEQRILLCREADYFTLLGVSRESSPYEIRQAQESLERELAPGRLAALDATDLDPDLADVRYLVNEAVEVLCDDALREAYRQARFADEVVS